MSIPVTKDSEKVSRAQSRRAQAVALRLQGATLQEIGTALGVTRQRALAMLKAAEASGDYSVHVQVMDAQGVELPHVATYLTRALGLAGLVTHR